MSASGRTGRATPKEAFGFMQFELLQVHNAARRLSSCVVARRARAGSRLKTTLVSDALCDLFSNKTKIHRANYVFVTTCSHSTSRNRICSPRKFLTLAALRRSHEPPAFMALAVEIECNSINLKLSNSRPSAPRRAQRGGNRRPSRDLRRSSPAPCRRRTGQRARAHARAPATRLGGPRRP
jgi:hypothetical protein